MVAVWRPGQPSRSDKVYRIGFGDDVPFHFRGADGGPTGVAVDIVKAAAARRGVRLDWVDPAQGGIDAIRSGDVDFWVLLTNLPERRNQVHFTQPYLSAERCFVVLTGGQITQPKDLVGSRIGYRDTVSEPGSILPEAYPNADVIYLRRYFPQATPVTLPSNSAQIPWQDLADHFIDALLLNKNAATALLLSGGNRAGLRMLPAQDSGTQLALASSFATAPVADRIRDAIRTMADDGSLSEIVDRWGYFQNVNLDVIHDLANARSASRLLEAGVLLLLCLLAYTGRLTLRLHRQRNSLSQTQDALRQSENYYRSLVEVLPDTIYRAYEDGRLVEPPAAGESARAKNCLAALAVSASHRSNVMTACQTRQTQAGEEICEGRVLEYRLIPIEDDRVLGVLRDVTAERRAQEENRRLLEQRQDASRLESLGQLAGGVAHDFNNLLTVINGYSGLLLKKLTGQPDLRSQVEHILTAGNSAKSLTEQLLAFSQRRMIEPEVLDLNQVVSTSVNMLRQTVGEKVALELDLASDLKAVMATLGSIQQVLINLAANARDAMPEGGVLAIRTANVEYREPAGGARSPATQACALLLVRDSGSGISGEVQNRMFEPFFTTKERGRGTGLGLSTVYGIVKQANGFIEVESKLGLGTAFRIYLPALDAVANHHSPQAADASESAVPAATVLFAEDEPGVRSMGATVLRMAGWSVLEAGDGAQALEMARNYPHRIDLLISDLMMPRMLGTELADRLRASRPDVRVLFITGYAPDAVDGRAFGGAPYLLKPFSPDKFVEAATEALAGSLARTPAKSSSAAPPL
jgi:signal transduction histidine kinase/ActR/RegA family two-component response regulator